MSDPNRIRILHPCEVEIYTDTGPPERCGAIAVNWAAPSGRAFYVCDEHIAVFKEEA